MTPPSFGLKEVALLLLARVVSGPGFLVEMIQIATLSVLHDLAKLLKMGLADDIEQLKKEGLRRSKAKTDTEEAKVRELLAKAVEAENRANLVNRNDRISKAEEKQRLAEASKTNAEAEAIRAKATAVQMKAKTEAFAALVESLNKLKEKGGNFAVNPKNLAKLLGVADLDDLDDGQPPHAST